MSALASFVARWRVRLGYLIAIIVLLLARPNPRSVAIGAAIGLIGLWIRAYAAGYLQKQEVLAVTGPYAHTRNPLYFGSFILCIGAAVAMWSWVSGALLLIYFALVYAVVMRREEGELRLQHPESFDRYAQAVPLFFPRLTPAPLNGERAGAFSFARYKKNHEHEAAIGFVVLLIVLLAIWRLRLH